MTMDAAYLMMLEMLKRIRDAEFEYGLWPTKEEIDIVIEKAKGASKC